MYLLPCLDQDLKLHDGTFIHLFSFCEKNCLRKKCTKHYTDLFFEKKSVFKKCPYGLVSYIHVDGDKKTIFTSLREKALYQKKSKRFLAESVYNPVLTREQLLVLIGNSIKKHKEECYLSEKIESFDSMAHEVKKLNSQIKEYCDSLINLYYEKNDYMALTQDEYANLFEKIKSLYIISSMITSRYTIYDYDKNPEILSYGSKLQSSIHGKFLKCSKILKNYKNKNSHIKLEGETHKCLKTFPSFEMVPFLLIENALKYALDGTEINVKFTDGLDSLQVSIVSVGPYCSQDDISHIFDKGFRGTNAKKASDGNGIGLYFVKLICDLHNISISAESDSILKEKVGDIPYTKFSINLLFNEVFDSDK